MLVDLHMHSTASDGSLTPSQLVQHAFDSDVRALALTDHDTVAGVPEAQHAGEGLGLQVLAGVELSVDTPWGNVDVLAYAFDPHEPHLNQALEDLIRARVDRVPRMVSRLNEAGVELTVDDVAREVTGVPGRPHVAHALVRHGVVRTVQEAFDRYLAEGRPGYVSKPRLGSDDALALVHAAGGVASLAHPVHVDPLKHIYGHLVEAGLDGIEVWHSDHKPEDTERFHAMAKRDGLLATGGSDFHGTAKPDVRIGTGRGNVRVPAGVVDELLARARREVA